MNDDYLKRMPKRHVISYIDSYTINYLHLRNPWVNAWWSAAFPGLGHLMLCKYLVAFVLLLWEVSMNQLAGINQAIYYSMIGEFGQAAAAIDKTWFLLYISVYVFAIWDSYSRTVMLNTRYKLSYKEGYDTVANNISGLELNILAKREPINTLVWSFVAPGIGHLYLNRIITSIMFLMWFIIISYFSHMFPAIHYTMEGNFAQATQCLDVQWFLYFPSLYAFIAYDGYVNTVEYNKIYEREQAGYLRNEFQDKNFDMPI